MLLGTDFLKANGVIIDYTRQIVSKESCMELTIGGIYYFSVFLSLDLSLCLPLGLSIFLL